METTANLERADTALARYRKDHQIFVLIKQRSGQWHTTISSRNYYSNKGVYAFMKKMKAKKPLLQPIHYDDSRNFLEERIHSIWQIIILNEAHASKTCGICGQINSTRKERKTLCCSHCEILFFRILSIQYNHFLIQHWFRVVGGRGSIHHPLKNERRRRLGKVFTESKNNNEQTKK